MKVSLFITCLSDIFFPEVGKSVVSILERNGVEVDVPLAQTCCGQPAYNSGYVKDARKAAKQTIQAFQSSEYVVAPSGSCAAMVRHYYPDMFDGDPEWSAKAAQLADKTFEFTEFVVRVLGIDDVGAVCEDSAAYHQSCHMSRGLGVRSEPVQLLSRVEGLEMKELPYCQDCCGFGGTFAAKMSAISEAMVDEKIRHLESTGAKTLIGSDMGCLMNIAGRLRRTGKNIQTMHIAEVLAKGMIT
ncbi:L-lactate dehydrogenase complex protein LldE [Paenibacillus forsythiae]|uniref:L-lactate dehydrogenase complex protein LldE n=1 Tax=Paenibacillus forsythiae TaxID=365616 RepID=A0ABU3H542_9BACL|nr:(Fe-S)-binding protein [Paenibacillus forsythiae]MDT3425841.1 L-lactate dehydrogenase complex protein LldE [Paenibacillus forsythiae]